MHGNFKHGGAKENSTLYVCWIGMKRRCYNPNDRSYKDYGGRGIRVCKEWKNDFINFQKWALANGWQKGLTIERINVNKNYHPLNCTWITKAAQTRNTRGSKLVEHNGKKLTVKEWSEITGVSRETIRRRIFLRGWGIQDALIMPPESAISSNKLSEQMVIEIFASKESAAELSKRFPVGRGAIWAIKRGSTWSHITNR